MIQKYRNVISSLAFAIALLLGNSVASAQQSGAIQDLIDGIITSGLGEPLKPRRHVDAISANVVAVDDNVTVLSDHASVRLA